MTTDRHLRYIRRASLALAVLAGLGATSLRLAVAQEPKGATEVKVVRERPSQEKTSLGRNKGDAGSDSRDLDYARLLAEAQAARDTVAAAEDERSRRHLLHSITQLSELEAQLDQIERQLADQRFRLATIENDFTGPQSTRLMVIVKGYPSAVPVGGLSIVVDDGDTVRVALSDEHRESLQRGGLLEIFRGAVEPRPQTVQVTLSGEAWPTGDTAYLTIDPLRDRLTFLRLDLSAVQPAQGGASIRASTWLHEAPVHRDGG